MDTREVEIASLETESDRAVDAQFHDHLLARSNAPSLTLGDLLAPILVTDREVVAYIARERFGE